MSFHIVVNVRYPLLMLIEMFHGSSFSFTHESKLRDVRVQSSLSKWTSLLLRSRTQVTEAVVQFYKEVYRMMQH